MHDFSQLRWFYIFSIENTIVDAAEGRPFTLSAISDHFDSDLDVS